MIRHIIKRLAFAGLLIALGCEVTDTLSGELDFGDSYVINTAAASPRLDVEGLHLTVQYGGGCERHQFAVRYRQHDDTTEIWLHHDGRGDTCEAYLTEALHLDVSRRALETANVLLLGPDGTTYALR